MDDFGDPCNLGTPKITPTRRLDATLDHLWGLGSCKVYYTPATDRQPSGLLQPPPLILGSSKDLQERTPSNPKAKSSSSTTVHRIYPQLSNHVYGI